LYQYVKKQQQQQQQNNNIIITSAIKHYKFIHLLVFYSHILLSMTAPLQVQVHFFVEICIFHFQMIWKWTEKESETKLYNGVMEH